MLLIRTSKFNMHAVSHYAEVIIYDN